MSKVAMLLAGLILGGMFANDKMSAPHETEQKTEIVYGTRIGPSGDIDLVVTR